MHQTRTNTHPLSQNPCHDQRNKTSFFLSFGSRSPCRWLCLGLNRRRDLSSQRLSSRLPIILAGNDVFPRISFFFPHRFDSAGETFFNRWAANHPQPRRTAMIDGADAAGTLAIGSSPETRQQAAMTTKSPVIARLVGSFVLFNSSKCITASWSRLNHHNSHPAHTLT